ncbi:MAG TPA: gliding motility-associated C-terminal domain-containing protein [Algoriphagus sp.]|nr:gliding motility-associated C-terminal domain-containing protein [Algoriphagus sp.]
MRLIKVCLSLVGVIFGSVSGLFAQGLTLTSDAILSANPQGMVVSTGSLKLSGTSQLHGVEAIRLISSDFIQLENAEVRLKTGRLEIGKAVRIPVGIQNKTSLTFISQNTSTVYQIGMDQNPEQDALPFVWSIAAFSEGGDRNTEIEFAWEKEVEPVSFSLKALVEKNQGDWDLLLEQQVEESMISLNEYSDFDSEGTVFTVKNFTRDLDEDEVPDIKEIGQVTDLKDPGKYLDTDGDGVPDYVEIQNETNPNDPVDFKDTEVDGVPDYVGFRSPVSFLDLQDVEISWGFQSYASLFQDSVLTMLGSGRLLKLPLSWDFAALNIYARGTYPVTSELFELPSGVFNGYKMRSEVNGIVLPKPSPLDFNLTNSNFIGDDKIFFIPVGAFVVTDPVDQIHDIKLNGPGYDNKYFEVKDNFLFWSSAERAEGMTNFTILMRVTDRDGNMLDKFFEIERKRFEFSEIEVKNTFTPNNDGFNDTWGVPEIRFFKGARVQVFDRNGDRVFYTEDPDKRWNGTYKGKELPVGTYYWILELRETMETRKGLLNLIKN